MGTDDASTDPGLDRVRAAASSTWEAMAPGWERRREYLRDFSQPVTDWLVDHLAPKPGETILEVGAATGETGFAAARRIGPTGHLISSDLPPSMVEVARRRAAELGIDNAEFRVMDAEHMDLADASVDGIVCRWAFMLMADPGAALAECRRVLRPGGRIALAVMGGPRENPWGSIAAKAIVDRGLIPPIDVNAAGGLFSLADHERLRAVVERAGFDDVRIEETEFHLRFTDFEDFWTFLLEFAGAIAILVRSFSEEDRTAVRDATERGSERFRTAEGYDLPGLSVNALVR